MFSNLSNAIVEYHVIINYWNEKIKNLIQVGMLSLNRSWVIESTNIL